METTLFNPQYESSAYHGAHDQIRLSPFPGLM